MPINKHKARLDILWSLNIPGYRTAQTPTFFACIISKHFVSRFLLTQASIWLLWFTKSPLDFLPNKLIASLLSYHFLAAVYIRILLWILIHVTITPFTSVSYGLISEKLYTSEIFGYFSYVRYQESSNQDSTRCRQTFYRQDCCLLSVTGAVPWKI